MNSGQTDSGFGTVELLIFEQCDVGDTARRQIDVKFLRRNDVTTDDEPVRYVQSQFEVRNQADPEVGSTLGQPSRDQDC